MWQSFVHGLGLSTAWEWVFTTDKNHWGYGLMPSNPDALARMGTTTFDANRLAYEIQAIQQEEPSVALLMSYKTRIWNRAYSNAQYKVYENCLANGQKVEFIIEEQIDRIHDYDLVVGPTADDDTAYCLKAYWDGLYGKVGSESAKQILLNNLETDNLGIQYFVGKQDVADTLIKQSVCIEWR